MIVHDGTNLIKDEIKLKCRADIKKANDEAKARIDEINSQADSRISSMKDKIISDAIRRADAEANRIRSRTNVEVRGMVAHAREELAASIVSDAIAEFSRMDHERMRKALFGVFNLALGRIDGEKVTLVADRRTQKMLGDEMIEKAVLARGKKINVSRVENDVGGGFILADDVRGMRIDCTFRALAVSKEDAVRKRIIEAIS